MKKKLVQMIDVAKTVSALSAADGCWTENGSRSLDAVFRMPVFQEGHSRGPKTPPDSRAAGCAVSLDRAAASIWKDAPRSGTAAN